MVEIATRALADVDLILWVVDISTPPTDEDRQIAGLLGEHAPGMPTLIAMNKLDLVPIEHLSGNVEAFQALAPGADWTTISATTGQGQDDLLRRVVGALPEGPRYYPADQLSDAPVRDIAAEVVREKALLRLREEVPHGVAVVVEEFKKRDDNVTYIAATVYVERESQKGILIGKRGAMLRNIGKDARVEIEEFLDTRVYLELWVKVLKNWRKDEDAMRRLGYRLPRR
jgi:GTP-binding protein Era